MHWEKGSRARGWGVWRGCAPGALGSKVTLEWRPSAVEEGPCGCLGGSRPPMRGPEAQTDPEARLPFFKPLESFEQRTVIVSMETDHSGRCV